MPPYYPNLLKAIYDTLDLLKTIPDDGIQYRRETLQVIDSLQDRSKAILFEKKLDEISRKQMELLDDQRMNEFLAMIKKGTERMREAQFDDKEQHALMNVLNSYWDSWAKVTAEYNALQQDIAQASHSPN